ncbi:hypothetical protein N7451_000503 [Penicillium sp. IBT 35674x]|nr:hypothetical protein N7451_000503 [Penicillium sp. IBT 35674x]
MAIFRGEEIPEDIAEEEFLERDNYILQLASAQYTSSKSLGGVAKLLIKFSLTKLTLKTCPGRILEDLYDDLYEEEKPVMYKELGDFVMSHVRASMRKLIDTLL